MIFATNTVLKHLLVNQDELVAVQQNPAQKRESVVLYQPRRLGLLSFGWRTSQDESPRSIDLLCGLVAHFFFYTLCQLV